MMKKLRFLTVGSLERKAKKREDILRRERFGKEGEKEKKSGRKVEKKSRKMRVLGGERGKTEGKSLEGDQHWYDFYKLSNPSFSYHFIMPSVYNGILF